MTGGKVIEVCDVPEMLSRLFVDVADRPYSRVETCAIYVEKNETSQKIQIGDSLWWQGRIAYWTPQRNTDKPREELRDGDDFDIPVRRIGYSGVKHPRDWTQADWDDFYEENGQASV